MAPSNKKLEAALIDGTCEVFKSEPDATTVNKVRKQVEEGLGLEDGFFLSEEWKSKSKSLIKHYVEKLLDGWTPDDEEGSESKNGIKRQSSESKSPDPKRRKREPRSEEADNKGKLEESELSADEKPKKAKTGKPAARRKIKAPDEDEEDEKPKPKAKARVKSSASPDRKHKAKAGAESDEDTKMKDLSPVKSDADLSDDEKPSVKKTEEAEDEAEDKKPAIDEEDEYSDVIDEGPKPKRKKKEKGEPAPKLGKSVKAAKPKDSSADDPDEAEIKKLQAQLVKCGVRKLWHNELKRYGSDARAKIKHLRKMLTDIGMDGRFSEAKAREIKETRELLAEAEAAQEMNNLWGAASQGRASRSKAKAKSMKVDDSDDSEADDVKGVAKKEEENDDDEEETTFAARRRARADLAFLGDDSDSD